MINDIGPCEVCHKVQTAEGHDPCIGTLPGVMNACCGHGDDNLAYVQFDHDDYMKDSNKVRIDGTDALEYISQAKLHLLREKHNV